MSTILDATTGVSDTLLGAGVPTVSFVHTCTGVQLLLVVQVLLTSTGGVQLGFVTGVTYNSVPLVRANSLYDVNNNRCGAEVWYLVNPLIGAHNVVVNYSTPNASNRTVVNSSSYNGVDQITPLDASSVVEQVTTTPSLNVTTGVANALITSTISRTVFSAITPATVNALTEVGAAYNIVVGPPAVFTASWSGLAVGVKSTHVLVSFAPVASRFIGVNEVDV